MIMKTIKFSILSAAAILAMASCSTDDVAGGNDKKAGEKQKKTTTFASAAKPVSRTSMTNHQFHTGGDFLWETDDQIFVQLGGGYTQSVSSLPTSTKESATFEVPGVLTEQNYPVTYTGKNSTAGDRVKIAAVQTQIAPNNTQHFGASGDCGVATAQKGGDGKYTFSLQHKAAYLCFLPSLSNAALFTDIRLDRIVVTSNRNIAGDYVLSNTGLGADPVGNPSQTITLNTKAIAG